MPSSEKPISTDPIDVRRAILRSRDWESRIYLRDEWPEFCGDLPEREGWNHWSRPAEDSPLAFDQAVAVAIGQMLNDPHPDGFASSTQDLTAAFVEGLARTLPHDDPKQLSWEIGKICGRLMDLGHLIDPDFNFERTAIQSVATYNTMRALRE